MTICVDCGERTGSVNVGAEVDDPRLLCGICAVGQIVCDAMRKQGMSEDKAAGEWNYLHQKLDEAYLEQVSSKAH